jgi:hypothetical protein
MGPTSILLLDVLTLAVAVVLHRRYPQAAYEDVGVLVLIGALMLALGPTTPALVISAAAWAALAIKVVKTTRRGMPGAASW